jgi:hypothetical protein
MAILLKNESDKYRKVVAEQMLLRDKFPFLNSRISGFTLTCRGHVRPTDHSQTYRIEIQYTPWNSPEVRIIDPVIKYIKGVHMYRNDTLCLYDWREQPWQNNWRLHETIVPWTAEWLVFYEMHQLTGKWLGPEAKHEESEPTQLSVN